MTGEGGRFEKGRWVDFSEPSESYKEEAEESPSEIDERIRQATDSVIKGVKELLSLGHELVTTPEGRGHLDKKVEKKVRKLEEACDEIGQEANDLIDRIRKKVSK